MGHPLGYRAYNHRRQRGCGITIRQILDKSWQRREIIAIKGLWGLFREIISS